MKFVPNSVTRVVGKQALLLAEKSPTLLFVGGVAGVVGTVVLASRATLRLGDIIEETGSRIDDIKNLEHSATSKYSKQQADHDKAIFYLEGVVKIAKLYAPAVVLGTVSIGMLAGSHRILTKRNAALTAAYTALETGFNQYRARVVEELGEDKDREFRYGTQKITVVDEETGKKSKVKVLGDGSPSIYARLFDEMNLNWQGLPNIDRIFLDAQQQAANNRLRAYGYLLLNDVYDSLGIPRSPEGCVVGWRIGGEGDQYVDFGMGNWPSAHDYIHAKEHGILLDFNVDGVIYKAVR